MRENPAPFVAEALPEFDPVVFYETNEHGWRGLTENGEVLEVTSGNGHDITVPSEIIVAHQGVPVGHRYVTKEWAAIDIDDYLLHFNRVIALYKANRIEDALVEADATIWAAPTWRAKFNRAMILLAAGRWHEGFREYWRCEERAPFMRPQVRAALDKGLRPWKGESLHGKRILLMHAHGFGDSIMALRYVPMVRAMGADVVTMVPPELETLAMQLSAATTELIDADYFCPLLHLLGHLGITPKSSFQIPYLHIDPVLIDYARKRIKDPSKRRIGIAWSIGKPSLGDYPREIPLETLIDGLGEADLYSVQAQNGAEAAALGVHVSKFSDFADCAALMLLMDRIVSVDTAALHLAGAIGHPSVRGLLSHWSSWRWIAPWYINVKLCRQAAPDDWNSALAQV